MENLRLGIEYFNQGKYWEAHEAWELEWLKLQGSEKIYLQAMIQVAAMGVLLQKGRSEPARRLVQSALAKLAAVHLEITSFSPRVEIPGVENVLRELDRSDKNWMEKLAPLRASLVLSSGELCRT